MSKEYIKWALAFGNDELIRYLQDDKINVLHISYVEGRYVIFYESNTKQRPCPSCAAKEKEIEELKRGGCICHILDKPCQEHCTCLNGLWSHGCNYCATYGSIEQRKARAKDIAEAVDNYPKLKSSLQQKEETIKKLVKGLEDVDSFLYHLEDYTYGDEGKQVTFLRGKIQSLLQSTKSI